MGKGIVDNEKRNVDQHIEIRKEQAAGDAVVRNEVEEIKDTVVDIRLEQMEHKGILTEQRNLLREIKEKL